MSSPQMIKMCGFFAAMIAAIHYALNRKGKPMSVMMPYSTSLYYLAAMLEGGEDPRYIARRMIILASEDVGNADPRALEVAVAAAQALEHVGLPEAQLNLSQAALYLSRAPTSKASRFRRPPGRNARSAGRVPVSRAWATSSGVPSQTPEDVGPE